MTDNDIKEMGEIAWNQYWGEITLSGKCKGFQNMPDNLTLFFKMFFTTGFLEGFKTKEENAVLRKDKGE